MSVSAISFYRGGAVEHVTLLSKRMKDILQRYGVSYQVSRFQTDQELGDWVVFVRYADWAAYNTARESFAHDPEHGQVVGEISKIVTLVKREVAVDLDL